MQELERTTRRVALAVASLVIAYLYVAAFEPIRNNWGDPWSDANVLTTLEYSAKYGFWKTSFTDVLDIGPLTDESYRYTHYPPLAEIFYGCVRKIVGKADIAVYRLFAVTFSGVMLVFLRRWVARVFGDLAGSLAVILFATNLLFVQFADSIHQAPILNLTGAIALWATTRWLDTGRRKWLGGVIASASACFLCSYDFFFFLPLTAIGISWLLGKKLRSRETITITVALAASGVIALGMKSLFVIGAIGWSGFHHDIVFQFFERATTHYSTDYRAGLRKVALARGALYFTPLFFVLLAFHAGALVRAIVRRGKPDPASVVAPALFFFAGVPFLVVFSQLAAEQVLPAQTLVPYYAIGFAVVIAKALARPSLRVPAIGVAVALVAWQGWHFARFEKSTFSRDDTRRVQELLHAEDRTDILVTNLMADGQIQYYFERHFHPPAMGTKEAGLYHAILGQIPSDRFHFLFFKGPASRFVDKSLWPILASTTAAEWWWLGDPTAHKAECYGAIDAFDDAILAGLAGHATKVLETPTVDVYRIGDAEVVAAMASEPILAAPTTRIDFGDPRTNVLKVFGIRGAESSPDVGGFAWTSPRQGRRTLLTKEGVQWRPAPSINEALLALNLPPGADYRITLRVWGDTDGLALGARMNETVVMPLTDLGARWQKRELAFVVPRAALVSTGIQALALPFNHGSENGVAVALQELVAERQ